MDSEDGDSDKKAIYPLSQKVKVIGVWIGVPAPVQAQHVSYVQKIYRGPNEMATQDQNNKANKSCIIYF